MPLSSVATIAAELQDGSRIVGQNDISHPHQAMLNNSIAIFEGQPMLLVISAFRHLIVRTTNACEQGDDDGLGYATPGDIDDLPEPDPMTMLVNKMEEQSLRSPIKDIHYINSFGRQVRYPPQSQLGLGSG